MSAFPMMVIGAPKKCTYMRFIGDGAREADSPTDRAVDGSRETIVETSLGQS